MLKITTSEDTVLHIAISNGQTDTVRQLVQQIEDTKSEQVLGLQNVMGSTAIHLAASFGDASMCECIASKAPRLIGISNSDGETPVFLAAAFGKKDSFFCLLEKLHMEKADEICHRRSRKGDTILHAALSGEHFGAIVDDLNETHGSSGLKDLGKSKKYPENYETCMTLFHLMHKIAVRSISLIIRNCIRSKSNEEDPESFSQNNEIHSGGGMIRRGSLREMFPPNYATTIELFKFITRALLIVLGLGHSRVSKVQRMKVAHTWATLVLNALVDRASLYKYQDSGRKPPTGDIDQGTIPQFGIDEQTTQRSLVNKFVPDLGVENKHVQVFKLLKEKVILKESVFGKVDVDGNSALHLAATFGDSRPWLIPGAGLQMQWELKWYKYVKQSMPPNFFPRYNKRGYTPKQILAETHNQLAKNGSEWLTKTSESCSVVAALIATVAFAGSATVPGGTREDTGEPVLVAAFNVFAITSLVALCLSVTSLVTFLTILTSRFEHRDFAKTLPRTLIWGLTTLFLSITAMLVSFCAAHFYILEDSLRMFSYPVYAATCLPVTIFLLSTFSLYYDLIWAIYSKEPQHSFKEFHP
ncbi:hypothetical protein LINPERHAP2_LOCUS17074 [Linum perenne]